jgi:hypothetical protein
VDITPEVVAGMHQRSAIKFTSHNKKIYDNLNMSERDQEDINDESGSGEDTPVEDDEADVLGQGRGDGDDDEEDKEEEVKSDSWKSDISRGLV